MAATADLPTVWRTLGDHGTRLAVLEEHDENQDNRFAEFRDELRFFRHAIIGSAVTVCLTAIGTCIALITGLPAH